jgi:phosphoglycerate dehydrogenase-like enzyme
VTRIAVLDDYQSVAADFADWSTLLARLEPFDVIVAMRERTPFRRSLLERLPHLKLLVTTGQRNAAIDVATAAERGASRSAAPATSPRRLPR